jgi:hypothetical protein
MAIAEGRGIMKLWGFLFVAATGLWPACAQGAEIGRIRAQLVYEETGRLSEDILAQPDFVAWNTIIGEGSAEEPANDLLVMVEVTGRGGQENIAEALEIAAQGDNGRALATRRFGESLLTSDDGHVWKSLWLSDVGCAGHIQIIARIGRSTRQAELDLDCGE